MFTSVTWSPNNADGSTQQQESEERWHDIPAERSADTLGDGELKRTYPSNHEMAYRDDEKSEEEMEPEVIHAPNQVVNLGAGVCSRCNQNAIGTVSWVLTHGKTIPGGAIIGGRDTDGADLWITRAFYANGVHPGKAYRKSPKGAALSFGGKEIEVHLHELLVGDPRAVKWVEQCGPLSIQSLCGARPVEGGFEDNGTALYVARAPYLNGTQVGKCSEKLSGCHFGYGGKEQIVTKYEVLVYNN
jgi:hypothetical protein